MAMFRLARCLAGGDKVDKVLGQQRSRGGAGEVLAFSLLLLDLRVTVLTEFLLACK
jgi:hypothetical protein